jgi:glycosyltransferase involved in cell wall biosynthesis
MYKSFADELVIRGNQVIILVPGQLVDKVVRVGNPLIFTWPSMRPTKLQDATFLTQIVKSYKPNCFIANWAAVNWMMIIGIIFRIPVRIAWNHTLTKQIDLDWTGSILRKNLLRFRKRLVYWMATTVVSVSSSANSDVRKVYKIPQSRGVVFHNAIEDPLKSNQPLATFRNKTQIVCPGRLDESKGQHVLIQAISLIRNEFNDFEVFFLGSGKLKGELITLAKQLGVREKCHFLGNLRRREFLGKLSQAYISVIPSRSEAFGLVVVESIAVGTPAIASDVGGIPEIIRNGIDGYLVPPDDANILSKKILYLCTHPQLRNKMSKNARQRFLDNFEVKKAVKTQIDWLETEIQIRVRN